MEDLQKEDEEEWLMIVYLLFWFEAKRYISMNVLRVTETNKKRNSRITNKLMTMIFIDGEKKKEATRNIR